MVAINNRHPFLIFIRCVFGENCNFVACFRQDFPEPNWRFTHPNVEWIRLVQEHVCRPKNDWVRTACFLPVGSMYAIFIYTFTIYHLKKETNVGNNTIHGSHYIPVLRTSFLWPQASSQSSSVSLILLMHTWYGENEYSMSDGVRSITTALRNFWIINSTLHTDLYFDVPKLEKEKRIYQMVMYQKWKNVTSNHMENPTWCSPALRFFVHQEKLRVFVHSNRY